MRVPGAGQIVETQLIIHNEKDVHAFEPYSWNSSAPLSAFSHVVLMMQPLSHKQSPQYVPVALAHSLS